MTHKNLSNLYWAPGLLSDNQIRELCNPNKAEFPMLTPFVEKQKGSGVISYGLSSYGYDATLAPQFKVAKNTHYSVIDPHAINEQCFEDVVGDTLIIPPNGFVLGRTNEHFHMPDDVLSICFAKSTYARCGLVIGVTPIEPGFQGTVTLEFSNTTPNPIRIYANQGICQFMFFKGSQMCDVTYAMRGGKYMGQVDVTHAKVLPK